MRSLNLVFNCSQWGGGGCFVCGRVILRGCVALLPGWVVDLRCSGVSVVEYSGKVACPSGRRCSTRNAVWCHSHPGFKSQRYRHRRPAPLGLGGFVVPDWCEYGCVPVPARGCVCRGMLLCDPTGVRRRRARPHGPGVLHTGVAWCAGVWPGAWGRCPASPPPAGTVAPQLCLPDHRTPSTSVGRPFEMPE